MGKAVGYAVAAFVICLGMAGSLTGCLVVTVVAAVIGALGQ